MNKKLQTIQNLKSKLYAIQNKLEILQRQQIPNSTMPFKTNTPLISPKEIRSSKNPFFHSPTFWSGDPILGKQNQQRKSSPPKKKNDRRNLKPVVPQKLQKVVQTIQNDYYQSAPQTTKHQPLLNYEIQKQKNFREQKFFKNNRSPKNLRDQQTPRFQRVEKLRTYTTNLSNPILNPDPEKPSGKKIVRRIQRSPDNPYTENPGSSTWMYTSQRMNAIFLSPNRHTKKDRNNSPNLRQILSSSLELNPSTKNRSKGKKHFSRYFEQNFHSKWG